MMRLLFKFIFLLIVTNAFAQDKEAKLFFKDGTSAAGYAEIKEKGFLGFTTAPKILFRLSKDDKPDEWDHETVSKIEFYAFEYYKKFEYVNVKSSSGYPYQLLEVVTEGEVNLYVKTTVSNSFSYFNPNPGSPGRGFYVPSADSPSITITYLVKRGNENKLTKVGSKNRILKYFSDCPGIKQGFDEKEFAVKDIKDIVEFYNDNCSTMVSDKAFVPEDENVLDIEE